jgi:hypothetical protein
MKRCVAVARDFALEQAMFRLEFLVRRSAASKADSVWCKDQKVASCRFISFHSMQADLADLSLEDAILGLLNSESICQTEASLQIYFTKPNALELIQPLLLSSHLRIPQSALVLLPRVIEDSQADSRQFPTTLSQTLWEIFLLFDDPTCLLTTWTVIGPTLRDINPDSFIYSFSQYFSIFKSAANTTKLFMQLVSAIEFCLPVRSDSYFYQFRICDPHHCNDDR